MKNVFLKVMELLKTVPEIRWIDMDKGQMDYYEDRPAVDFPCALIKTDITRTEDLGGNIQRCYVDVIITLYFDYSGETSADVPASVLESSLQYYDIKQDVYRAIQGKGSKEVGTFKRGRETEGKRPDRIKSLEMPFESVFIDESAA